MLEKLALKLMGSIGFLVNRKMRLNFYKQTGRTDGLWSGEMFEKLIQSIENPMPSVMITNNLNMNSNHYNLNINLKTVWRTKETGLF